MRRDAYGNGRGASARRRRVGKQSSVGSIVTVLSSPKKGRWRPSRKDVVRAADAANDGDRAKRCASWGVRSRTGERTPRQRERGVKPAPAYSGGTTTDVLGRCTSSASPRVWKVVLVSPVKRAGSSITQFNRSRDVSRGASCQAVLEPSLRRCRQDDRERQTEGLFRSMLLQPRGERGRHSRRRKVLLARETR